MGKNKYKKPAYIVVQVWFGLYEPSNAAELRDQEKANN